MAGDFGVGWDLFDGRYEHQAISHGSYLVFRSAYCVDSKPEVHYIAQNVEGCKLIFCDWEMLEMGGEFDTKKYRLEREISAKWSWQDFVVWIQFSNFRMMHCVLVIEVRSVGGA